MRILPILLFACLFAASVAHAENKIFKCTNTDGSSVFSPYPCGAGAREMKVKAATTSAPDTTTQPVAVPAAATPDATDPPVVDAEDIQCEQDAERLKTYPERANLNMLLQRQTEQMRAYASDASESTRILIGNMDATIAAEQTRIDEGTRNADRAYAAAIDKCQTRKAAREQQVSKP
jgi:hypothetical protein